jgi:hypothetical protein
MMSADPAEVRRENIAPTIDTLPLGIHAGAGGVPSIIAWRMRQRATHARHAAFPPAVT